MTLNEVIMELVMMTESPMMPHIFKQKLDRIIEKVSECEEPSEVPHWISVEERLPEEYDSIFKRYYGTNKWNDSMFLKRSNDVPVIEVYEDGSKRIGTAHTCDGQWRFSVPIINREVVAWMELKLGDFEP